MPRRTAVRATWLALFANLMLLGLKASATGLSDSLTIFSETLNSLADVVAAIVVLLCVRWAWKRPDDDHPFGHRRAEPIAGLVLAIFTGILGFEVCKTALLDLRFGNVAERIGPFPIAALCLTIGLKSWLYLFFARRGEQLNSPALRATAIDCRNDVFVAAQGLVAVLVAEFKLPLLDTVGGLLVGGYILYTAYRIGMENIDYLMGRAPDQQLLDSVQRTAAAIPGVAGVADIKGHYVGTFVHVELTAIVDGRLATAASHDVGLKTRSAIEELDLVDRAFVHIAPIRTTNSAESDATGDQR